MVSGCFDGGYAAQLAPVERVAQVALVLGLVAVVVLAGPGEPWTCAHAPARPAAAVRERWR